MNNRDLNRWAAPLGLFILAVAITTCLAVLLPYMSGIDGRYETLNSARTLAATGTLGNPFQTGPTGPTAHVAPVFPAIAALLIFLPFPWAKSLTILAIIICGLNAAVLPRASELFFGVRKPGIYAGVLSSIALGIAPQGETVLSALLCICACCAIMSGARLTWLVSGIAALTNPVCLLPIFVCALGPGKKKAASAAFGIALFCIPWAVRNWIELGQPSPVRDNFGFELSVSNNDCASAVFMDNVLSGCYQANHPSFSATENKRIVKLGEAGYNHAKMLEALNWIRRHPKRFSRLFLVRAIRYLFPSLLDGVWAIGVWIATALACLSLVLRLSPSVLVLQSAAFASWAPYAFQQSDLRFRSVSLWIWLLLAGSVICSIQQRRGGTRRTHANSHDQPELAEV